MTKAELNFINEMTRKLLVEWCTKSLQGRRPVEICDFALDSYTRIYIEHAVNKKWLSADGSRVLATGFNTAAAFLRR